MSLFKKAPKSIEKYMQMKAEIHDITVLRSQMEECMFIGIRFHLASCSTF